MKVFVFGNPDSLNDKISFQIVEKLKENLGDIEFITVNPNEDLPFADEKDVVIIDAIQGIQKVKVFSEKDVDKIVLSPRSTVHDYDLGFQLRYLKKLGRLTKVTIIGLPMDKALDYSSIHSIFKKLVAQDIQGS